MILRYSAMSRPSAEAIAAESKDIQLERGYTDGCDDTPTVNWGRERITKGLNADISKATNKRVMRELFKEHGVPMPKLLAVDGNPGFNNIITLPCVGRPDQHSRGRGFWLCNYWAEVAKAQNGTRRKAAATHFMEFIHADSEYRVHIFMDKSIRISLKNYDLEGSHEWSAVKPTCSRALRRKLRQAGKDAVKAIGLDFGAVDILTKDDDVYVLEVNTAPGLGGSLPKLYADAFLDWSKNE